MGLSTSDLPEGGTGLSKTFGPGNQKLKINSVLLNSDPSLWNHKHEQIWKVDLKFLPALPLEKLAIGLWWVLTVYV